MNVGPTQMTSKASLDRNGIIEYREFLPSEQLRPFIACYSTSNSKSALETPFNHRIIPDGCVNLIFDLADPSGQYGFVTGPVRQAQFVPMVDHVQLIGIRFFPGSALHFMAAQLQVITGRSAPLDAILGYTDTQLISEQLAQEPSIEKKVSILEHYIARHLKEDIPVDSTLNNAMHFIYASKGNIRISDLAKRLQVSHRQLDRKFNTWLGMSPKAFCRIVRFQSALKVLPGALAEDFISIALESGYYDQSHFIQEFHSLYGLSPSRFRATHKEL
ncbi:MAG: helix-turn-helix domain-containing protein [Chloroflexota bacterium]|nr:helix-turn-helix domain-containing protein [Chloroflexota bacterium]